MACQHKRKKSILASFIEAHSRSSTPSRFCFERIRGGAVRCAVYGIHAAPACRVRRHRRRRSRGVPGERRAAIEGHNTVTPWSGTWRRMPSQWSCWRCADVLLGRPHRQQLSRSNRMRSMQSLASAIASSFCRMRVCKVDCGKIGKSERVEEIRTHHCDHSRLGSIWYPRYVQHSVIWAPIEPRQ